MSAWWDASIYATCVDCGRDFEGSQRTIAAALNEPVALFEVGSG